MRNHAALPPATLQRKAPVPGDAAEPIHSCGWFESSYELSQGLQVTEGGDDDEGLLAELCIATLSFMPISAGSLGDAAKPTCH
ncbi:hypothetical protein [Paucibacter sp. B51]|uniref:hypothetical protein n=1 Tax=Paucibacter sp. B51 TaxID=2993315 RepID=UPI0022EBA5F6|nr:hypothetical protein [Paucibacter sp. B51]